MGAELSIVEIPGGDSVVRIPPTFLEIAWVIQGSISHNGPRARTIGGEAHYRTACPLPPVVAGSAGATCFFLHLDRNWHGWKSAGIVEPHDGIFTTRNADTIETLATIKQTVTGEIASGPLHLSSIVFKLLSETIETNAESNSQTRPGWLSTLLAELDSSAIDPAFANNATLTALAATAGISRAQLARAFRTHAGCSVGEYVRNKRIARARALLVRSERSIGEVGLECGFADQSHFTRAFQKVTGSTPGRYRETRRIDKRVRTDNIDPVGSYSFTSSSASGSKYDGTFSIAGEAGSYTGFAITPILPRIEFSEVLVVGNRITICADVPAGLAIITLEKEKSDFRGMWRLGNHGQALRAVRTG